MYFLERMNVLVQKGEWVQISSIVLEAGDRAPNIPDDTQSTPLKMWIKGVLQADAEIGDTVKIKTVAGREVEGELVKERPNFTHSFGDYVPEITQIRLQLTELLEGE